MRAAMAYENKKTDAETGKHFFTVGKYDLYGKRTCEEAREFLRLSNREMELIVWVGSGYTKRQIAERMGVSPSTADTFRRRAYAKLGVSTGSAAVAIVTTFLAGSRVAVQSGDSLA